MIDVQECFSYIRAVIFSFLCILNNNLNFEENDFVYKSTHSTLIWETESKAVPIKRHLKGRGRKKMIMMAVPLVVGFKVASIIVAAMTALKVLVLKTVAMSGLALIASIALGGKQIYDKMKEKKASHEIPHGTPYFYPGMTAQADMSWDPSNAAAAASGGYEIALGSGGPQDLSHLGTEYQASYAPSSFSSTGAVTALGNNSTSFGFVPVAQRKSHVRQPLYKTTLYKTTMKEV